MDECGQMNASHATGRQVCDDEKGLLYLLWYEGIQPCSWSQAPESLQRTEPQFQWSRRWATTKPALSSMAQYGQRNHNRLPTSILGALRSDHWKIFSTMKSILTNFSPPLGLAHSGICASPSAYIRDRSDNAH